MTYQAGRHFRRPRTEQHSRPHPARHRAAGAGSSRPRLGQLQAEIFERIRPVFKTKQPVMIFPASGTGGWDRRWSTRCRPATRC